MTNMTNTTDTNKNKNKKEIKKALWNIGLFFTKPLLWAIAVLLLLTGCSLAAVIYCYGQDGISPLVTALSSSLFTAATTALFLAVLMVIYQYCAIKTNMTFQLLTEGKRLLGKIEQGIHTHLRERKEKKRQKQLLQLLTELKEQNQQKSIEATPIFPEEIEEIEEPEIKNSARRLARLAEFLTQTETTLSYLQQIYGQLSDIGFTAGQTLAATQGSWLPLYEKLPERIKCLLDKIRKQQQCPEMDGEWEQDYEQLLTEILQTVTSLKEQINQVLALRQRQ